ncbi:hypothetical protein Tco_0202035 [Tanacetum coccineum]
MAIGPKRQPNAAAGAPGVAQDAPIVDEGGQADPTPIHAPPPPPPDPARTMPQSMARLEEDMHEIRGIRRIQLSVQYSVFTQLTNTAYPLPLDTTYRSSGTEIEILCMTRNSTSELFTPYKEPEQEFQSSRRHFKTLSLDELRSPDFNLFYDQEYSEEEEAEAMAETMEQYMSKTRTDYGSGVSRHKIEEKDSFELKGQFLKELRENTFNSSDNEDANEHIEKVLEIVDLFHVPNITEDQLMLRVFPISLTRAILNSRGVVPTKTAADAKKAIQEMAEYSQKWHNGTSRGRSTETSDGLAAIQAQLNNLGREIKKVNEKVYVAQVGCEQCK